VSFGFPEEDFEVDKAFSIDVENDLETDLLRGIWERVREAMIGSVGCAVYGCIISYVLYTL